MNGSRRTVARGFTATVVVFATAAIASATEAAHEAAAGAQGAHAADAGAWLGLGYSFLNFLMFTFLIRKYAWPAVRDFLASRHKEVSDAMAAAEQAKREADEIRREYASKEAALEETRRRLLEEIRQGAAADRERSLLEAQAAAQRLRAEAESQAQHDLARARRELRAEAARLAAELAEREVASRLTDADRARLVREFVEGVAKQ